MVADAPRSDIAAEAMPAPPCAMVIFGAGGDLTKRLVIPGSTTSRQRPSAPPHRLRSAHRFGFELERIVVTAREMLKRKR